MNGLTNDAVMPLEDATEVLAAEIPDFDGKYDYKKEYADAYYARHIERFQPNVRKRRTYRFIKRCFDIVVSASMLAVLLPLFFLLAVAVRCDSAGPVIFKQQRVGRGGKVFTCYKFRSMYVTAPRECATACLENPLQYQTRVGRVLRKLSLDELPQLWCVLVGTMSLIGYRPLILSERDCNEMRESLGVFALRPGISGYAQVCGRDDVYYKNKALLDAYYVKHAGLLLDIKLILRTVIVVIKRDGNHSEGRKTEKR